MEMQQVRYFLAVARTLNFTRAAEECNVTQPALTRAIKQLEEELGGELIRREGRLSHLTDLGNRMRPLLAQCYESALTAKALAAKVKKGEVASLTIAVSWTLDVDLLMAALGEVKRCFPELQLKIRRGSGAEIADMLKSGEVELAVGGPLGEEWDRLEAWPMFSESFGVLVGAGHRLAEHDLPDLDVELIRAERLLDLSMVGLEEWDRDRLGAVGISYDGAHEVMCLRDLERLVVSGFGCAILPASAMRSKGVRHVACSALDLKRTVAIYSVAGRPRSREAGALLNLLRSADWSENLAAEHVDAA